MKRGYLLLVLAILFSLFVQSALANIQIRGNVQNSSFASVQNANVTLYREVMGTKVFNTSVATGANGEFNISIANDDFSDLWVLQVVIYNGSAGAGNATEVSPELPPLGAFELANLMNNATFYTQPAATLNLTAINASNEIVGYSYIVFDEVLGKPVAVNSNSLVNQTLLVIPRNRNFTVIMMRSPELVGGDFTLASPPITQSVTNASSYSGTNFVIPVQLNLSYSVYSISGFVNISGNSSRANLSQVLVRLAPGGFVPGDMTIDLGTPTINNSIGEISPGNTAWFNVTVLGAAAGVTQILELYGDNGSLGTDGQFFGGIYNFTITGDARMNFTLMSMAGSYVRLSQGANRTAYTTFNLVNGDNSSLTIQDAHIELKVKLENGLSLRYFRFGGFLSNGQFNHSFVANRNGNVTLTVFSDQFAPLEQKLDISQNPITVSLKSFGMKEVPGALGNTSTTNFSSDLLSSMQVQFLKNQQACNVPAPDISPCRIGNSFSGSFNPLQAAMAGKVNLFINTSGVILIFEGVDMFASGPPDAAMTTAPSESTSGSLFTAAWKFGSLAPDIYDQVRIGIPYDPTEMNESLPVNITLKSLYDNSWSMVWNTSLYPSGTNLPSEYSDYNLTWLNQSNGGMLCLQDSSYPCYLNTTTNYIWLTLPHFSNVGASVVSGAMPEAEEEPAPTTSSSSGGGGGGPSAPTPTNRVSHLFTVVSPASPGIVPLEDVNLAITEMTVYVNQEVPNVKITVEELKEKPDLVTEDIAGNVYAYLEFTKQNLEDSGLDHARVRFKVPLSWLAEKGATQSDIALLRFSSTWNTLSTSLLRADEEYAYYEASIPGFSVFAIATQKKEAEEPAVEEVVEVFEEPEEEITPPPAPVVEEEEGDMGLLIAMIFLLALVLVAGIIVVRKKAAEKPMKVNIRR